MNDKREERNNKRKNQKSNRNEKKGISGKEQQILSANYTSH